MAKRGSNNTYRVFTYIHTYNGREKDRSASKSHTGWIDDIHKKNMQLNECNNIDIVRRGHYLSTDTIAFCPRPKPTRRSGHPRCDWRHHAIEGAGTTASACKQESATIIGTDRPLFEDRSEEGKRDLRSVFAPTHS